MLTLYLVRSPGSYQVPFGGAGLPVSEWSRFTVSGHSPMKCSTFGDHTFAITGLRALNSLPVIVVNPKCAKDPSLQAFFLHWRPALSYICLTMYSIFEVTRCYLQCWKFDCTTGWHRINRTIQPFNRVYKNLLKITPLTLVVHRQIRRRKGNVNLNILR